MAVIGSRANGTRVPDNALKGGSLGAALFDSAGAVPASDRRDVTFLGHGAHAPTESGARLSNGNEQAAPLDARSSLFVASTLNRVRKEWLDKLEEGETSLDPQTAFGFAGNIAQQFDDFSQRTLADMPDALRPQLRSGLARVGSELGIRARDFEAAATRVGAFNQTKQALDDLSDTLRHDRFDVPRILAEGRARIAEAPVSAGARRILEDYFLADLPLKAARAHIEDDPDDARAAIERAGREKREPTGTKNSAETDRTESIRNSSRSMPESQEGADPSDLYRMFAPEVRQRLELEARVGSAARRADERHITLRRLEQGIAENRVTPADIAASGLDGPDQERLISTLKTAEASERQTTEAVERFVAKPESFDPNNAEDRAQADRAFLALTQVTVGNEGDAVDIVALAGDFAFRSRFIPDAAVEQLRGFARDGTADERGRAVALLDEFNVDPAAAPAVVPEQEEADVLLVTDPQEIGAGSRLQAVEDPSTPDQDPPPDDDRTAFGVVLEVVDIVTDFVPVISEAKAVVEAIELSNRLTEAHERGDEAAVRELSAQLALTMTDLLPGPNIAGAVRRIASRTDGIPLINTLKEKLQRLLSKSKGEGNADADKTKTDVSDDTIETRKGEPDNGKKDNEAPDDEEGVEGKFVDWEIPSDVLRKLPEIWGPGIPNRKSTKNPAKAGFRWFDPDNKGNGVRIDRGNPMHEFPSQRVDHVIVRHRGRVIGRDGEPISGKIDQNAEAAHIPLSEYRTWTSWFKP